MADSTKPEPVKTEPTAPADPVAEPVAPTEAAAAAAAPVPPAEEAPAAAETAPAPAPKDDSVPAAVSAPAPEAVPAPEASEKAIEVNEKPAEPVGASAAAEPTKNTVTEPTADKPSAVAPKVNSPFTNFAKKLPDVLKEVGHDEMWGVTLVDETHIPTAVVIQKFLNANEGDVTKAIEQFTGALKFRKEKKPLELLQKTFNASKFGQLGAVTTYQVKDSAIPEVFTWNFYGNVKDRMDEVFVPLEE